ncbi:hypothetical protein LMIY3S_05352 [Labrys miyagiensis]
MIRELLRTTSLCAPERGRGLRQFGQLKRLKTPVTAALSIGFLAIQADGALADCQPASPGNYSSWVCSGPTTTGQIVPAVVLNQTVTTDSTFNLTLPAGPGGFGFALWAQGNGTLSFIDTNATTIDTTASTGVVGSGTNALYLENAYELGRFTNSIFVRSNGNYLASANGVSMSGAPGSSWSGTIDAEFTGLIDAHDTGLLVTGVPGGGATLSVNEVHGGVSAIQVTMDPIYAYDTPVTGDLTINTNGLVRGEERAYAGLPSYGIDVRLRSGTLSGIQSGVTTTINIGSNSIVEGNDGAIHANSLTGPVYTGGNYLSVEDNPIIVNNNGVVRNNDQLSSSLAISGTLMRYEINNNNLITGVVSLGEYGDAFSNTGTWNTANGANDFGAGTDHVDNRGTVIAAASAGTAETTSFDGLETFTNGGLLTMRDGGTGDVTRTSGDYVGDGGVMAMDTYLGTDGSPTDLWVINGDASGSTTLAVANAGGPGALTTKDGIKVVQVDGNSTSDAFRLARTLTAGAYDYNLFYGGVTDPGDQDWYLRSVGASASTQTALPYADTLVNYAEATLGTLQQRTGNRVWPNGTPPEAIWCKDPSRNFRCTPTGEQNASYADGKPVIYGQGAWGRIGGQYASYDPRTGSAYTQSLGFLQAGYEGVAHENGSGELTLGAFATIGTSRAEIDVSPDPVTKAARSGKITSTGYGLGGNLTWLGQDGFYADAVGQFTWYESDLSNKAGGGNSGWSSVLSLEAGRRFELGSGWALVPQAQLAWAHVDFDSFTDLNGARVALGDGDSLKGRLGLRVENLASWKNQQGRTDRLQLYAIANLSYQFLDGTSVEVAGSSFTQQNKRLWGEVGLGGSYAWNDEWSLYGEADYAAALSSGSGDNYALKGTAGLRYRW